MFTDPQINYHVKDAEVAARFYRESFGFTETFRTPDHGPPVHIEMRLGGLTLGFARCTGSRPARGRPGPRWSSGPTTSTGRTRT